jgi:simple sugar transport system permease protein
MMPKWLGKSDLMSEKNLVSLTSSVSAILVGLLFGLVILLISNPSQALAGFKTILFGGFTGGAKGIGQVLYFATPIIMTGLSVGFAFKTGLFNIGASGQFIMGAYAAVLVGVHWTSLPPGLHWIAALLAAGIAGGLWALLPGILKAYANVHEVIATIMMNYIGMYSVNYLVTRTVYDQLRNQSITPTAVLPKWGMDQLFPRSSVNGGFYIAILMVVLIHIMINKTTFGYELKACGFNRDASQYAGINAKRNIVLSMVIAGVLSGIGAGLLFLAGSGKHIEVVDILAAEGFNGIPVALLGMSSPIGILFAGLFIAYVTQGGFYLQLSNFVPEVIDIIIAAIIYFSAFSLIFKNIMGRWIRGRKEQKP